MILFILISFCDFIIKRRKCACLVKARDFLTMPNLRMLCFDDNCDDLDIRYVGGLWVMFQFKHKDACKNFMNSKAMDHWVTEKRPWDRNFVPSERFVWVDVEVYSLRAWSKETFKKILSKWGSIVHLDDELGEDVYKKGYVFYLIFKISSWMFSKLLLMIMFCRLELKKHPSGLLHSLVNL